MTYVGIWFSMACPYSICFCITLRTSFCICTLFFSVRYDVIWWDEMSWDDVIASHLFLSNSSQITFYLSVPLSISSSSLLSLSSYFISPFSPLPHSYSPGVYLDRRTYSRGSRSNSSKVWFGQIIRDFRSDPYGDCSLSATGKLHSYTL